MKHKKSLFLIFFFYIFSLDVVNAQTNSTTVPLKTLVERKEKLSYNHPFESVYLHFDKPYYAVGDTIWFKTYITIQQHLPSPLSKIVYVDLLNNKDSLIQTLKIPANNSVANGNIVLGYPDFKEGTYHLRAYTKWMLNFNQSYFFKKNIYVGNALNKELITNITFNGSITDKAQKVSSRISYKDELGKPLADKKVTWEVIADDEKIAKGKATTDAKGYITLDFSSSTKVSINRGVLNTALETSDRRILNSSFPLKTAILENDIQFFPEGGELIDGMDKKVAFKAIASNGLGVNLKGKILDEEGKEIVSFASQHLGMGSFSFIPQKNKKYTASITFADQTQKNFSLPPVKDEGISLSAKSIGDSLWVKINVNEAYLQKNQNQLIYIVAQNAGVFFYAAQTGLRQTNYLVKIPHIQFPTGILQLALLNINGLPLSERLVFIQRKDDVKINVKTDLPTYTGRQKIKMSIQTSEGFNPTEGSYSVSVINDAKVPVNENEEITIKSNLLLSADLEGYIEQPNYYFNKTNDQKLADLDILLLTQGYRRFLYKDLAADIQPKVSFFPEQSMSVSGTIRKSNGMPLENGRLLLQIPSKQLNTTGTTDKEGKFVFNNLIFKDSSEVIVNARNNVNSKDLRIILDGEAFPSIYSNVNAPDELLNIDSALGTYLKNSRIEHQSAFLLREVVVKSAAIKKPSHADYSALSGLSQMADREVSNSQLGGCKRLLDCLAAAGLTFIEQQLFLTRNYNQGLKVPIEIYANGMPVDVNYLAGVEVNNVESLEVFYNDGLSGINRLSNTSGVLVINMKEIKKTAMSMNQFKALFPPTNILTHKPKGFTTERKFYVPKYSGPRNSLQREDYRTTIYWNPSVNTDKDGNASFEFFNSDAKGLYRVVVEGLDNAGNIGRTVYKYQLK